MRRFVPVVPALSQGAIKQNVERVAEFLKSGNVCVLTGAGMSTESGIPDYRSPEGSYSKGHKPLTHQEFTGSELLRKRYWARAIVAAGFFKDAQPNIGHTSLAKLESKGYVSSIITQNVDRLHQRGGSKNVLELHGHTGGVRCRSCETEFSRSEYHKTLEYVNRDWMTEHLPEQNPDLRADGDADLVVEDFNEFHLPGCQICDGVLMPTIVFFGGNVPERVREESFRQVRAASKLLVLGSSVTVWSGFRLCKEAKTLGKELAVVNIGKTRADDICDFKVDQINTGPLLEQVTERLGRL
mmetsp:Transcript_2714/g.3886  ORF Transcript_2714/g.3886 Transcript_2714/m.3886 type:complete len:298 (-) Transcript_2714:950-1843(-)